MPEIKGKVPDIPLLPCPFCGRQPKLRMAMDYYGNRENHHVPHYWVACHHGRDHAISVGSAKLAVAMKRWNKRFK